MIKLIASDIDGTLVKDGTLAIDREYMDVIRRLLDKGIIFVACSGRQYRSERKLFAPVADRLLYITDGGTVVRTPKEILKVDTMPDEIWKGMLSMVHESLPSCDYYIATPDRGFAEDGGSRMFHWLRDSYGYDIQEISDPRILEDQQIIKFSVYHPNACEELYNKATKDNNDLVLFSRYDVNAETNEKIGNRTFHYNQNFKLSEKPYEFLKLSPFPWNKFIKKELFDSVEFPDKIRFEDLPVSFILASKAKSIGVINDFFYNYSVQVGFLSKFNDSTCDIAKAIDYLIKNLKERDCFDLYKNEVEYITVRHFFYRFEQLLTVYGEESFELKVKLINTLFDYLEENFPKFRQNKYIKYNLPYRIYNLFAFYSSREKLLDFVAKCKDMSKEEQDEYVENIKAEYEKVKEFEFKTFDKIKEETKAADEKYFKLKKELSLKDEVLYITAQEHSLPSSMLAMIKYIKTEKNDYKQIVVANSENKAECEDRLKRYNFSDVTVIGSDNEEYIKALCEAKYIFSDRALEYFFEIKEGQKYINLQTDCISAKMAKKREMEYFEFATAQKSIIASSASVYLNEVSQNSFEKAYRCEMLPTSTVIADSPALDMAGVTSFATANDKIKILFTPQFKATNGKNSATAYNLWLT